MTSSFTAAETFAPSAEFRRAARAVVWIAIRDAIKRAYIAMMAGHSQRRRVGRAITELSSLNDRMLKDIGVQRHDIPRMARYGRDATDVRAQWG
jgi:uncharacterized protein YjiS (DUF1127 family)